MSDPTHRLLYEHGIIGHNLYTGHGFAMNWPYESFDTARERTINEPPKWEGSFLPPLNPYIFLIAYKVFGENASALYALMIFYALTSCFIPLAVYRAGILIGPEFNARISSIAALLFLPSAYAVVTFSGSALYQLLGILVLHFAVLAAMRPSWRAFLALGISCGVMTMLRSEFFLLGFLLIATAMVLAYRSSSQSKVFQQAISGALLCAAIIAPWTIRNYSLSHKFVPVLSHPWYEMWRGDNVLATGSNYDANGKVIWVSKESFPNVIREMDSIPYDSQFEWKVDRIFQSEVIWFIQTHPVQFVWVGIKKLFFFFTVDPYYHRDQNFFSVAPMLCISLLTVVGMVSLLRDQSHRPAAVLFSLFFLYYIALTFMTVVLPRYEIYVFSCMLPVTGLIFRQPKLLSSRPSEKE